MRRSLITLLFLFSFSTLADVCICQYPGLDAKYGGANKGEIGFYKLGCAAWLLAQTQCRSQVVINENANLNEYIGQIRSTEEKIKIGYVGHWTSSKTTIDYLDDIIYPMIMKYKVPVHVENTACSSMDNPQTVFDKLDEYKLPSGAYIRYKGNQTTSFGLWNKVITKYNKANLYAIADTRYKSPLYPYCDDYKGRSCIEAQNKDIGSCISNGQLQKLQCTYRKGVIIDSYSWMSVN